MADEVQDILSKLGGLQEKDAIKEVGPGDVGPTVDTRGNQQLVSLPFDEELMTLLWKQVERAETRRTNREKSWDILLDSYMPIVSATGEAETVKVQAHFRNTHTKIGALFFRSPDVILQPDDPGPGNNSIPDPRSLDPRYIGQTFPPLKLADITALKQAILKKKLGRDGIKANRLMDELIFDVLQWAGIGCYKMGYKCTMRPMPKMGPDPAAAIQQPGSVLGLQSAPGPMVPQLDATGQPLMEDVPVYEEWYARRFSPKKYLCDPSLSSTRVQEDATWVGMDFFLTPKVASKKYGIPEDELNKAAQDDRRHEWSDDKGTNPTGLVHCIEMWLKSAHWTPDINNHPQAINQLVLVKGLKVKPAIWRPSPDQDFDPNTGRISVDSLVGFPIGVLTIRDLADSCFPPSDAAMTNSDIKQMSTWRRQSIRLRDAAIGKYVYDASAFGDDELELLKNGDIGEFIPANEGKMKDGIDKIFAQTSKVTASADDYRGFSGIKQDMHETLGIGSNQAGTETDTVRTATEADKVASAVQARNDKELGRVVDCFLDVVRGVDQLLMRYMTDIEYIEIGGEEAAAKIAAWHGKTISLKCLYDIAPDSQLRPDTARDFKATAELYNLTAKDKLMNRAYLLRRMGRMRGMDPAKLIMPPPPPPGPEPLKLTLTITADDLEKPSVLAFIEAYGKQAQPNLQVHGQPEHGGPADTADVISQHQQSNSGGKQNAPGAENHRESQVK